MPEKPKELANLARIGKLVVEAGTVAEIESLLRSGKERLVDARWQIFALAEHFTPPSFMRHPNWRNSFLCAIISHYSGVKLPLCATKGANAQTNLPNRARRSAEGGRPVAHRRFDR